MKTLAICSFSLLCLIILGGCKAEFKDVSDNDKYIHFVGREYSLLSPLYILGVNAYESAYESNKKTKIDYYKVLNYSFSGREVLSNDILERGSIFKILNIRMCTNCPFQDTVEFNIKILSGLVFKNIKIPIYLDDGQDNLTVLIEGQVELDPKVFKRKRRGVKEKDEGSSIILTVYP